MVTVMSPAALGGRPVTPSAVATGFPLIVRISDRVDVALRLVPGRPVNGLGAVLAELHHAAETGRLDRLKMCASEDCRWVYFDHSKPATRRWCSSALCGNRAKTRAYRTRHGAQVGQM
jgi:predicted RNA-binding Zn ribbon-like protein